MVLQIGCFQCSGFIIIGIFHFFKDFLIFAQLAVRVLALRCLWVWLIVWTTNRQPLHDSAEKFLKIPGNAHHFNKLIRRGSR